MSDDDAWDEIGVSIDEREGKFRFIIELSPANPGFITFDSGYIYRTHEEAQVAGFTALYALENDPNEH